MTHHPEYSFDQATYQALEDLAQQPGEENLGAPVDDQDRIQLLNFAPGDFTRLLISVQPDSIHVERQDGRRFGIADHSRNPHDPVSVLGQTVASLTVERSEQGWTVNQHPDQHLVVDDADSFGLFWRVLAAYVQDKRAQASQRAVS